MYKEYLVWSITALIMNFISQFSGNPVYKGQITWLQEVPFYASLTA